MSCDIRTIAITVHAAVELCLRVELEVGGRSRWRMSTSLLQDKSFKTSFGEDLKSFFEINVGRTEEIKTVWEASKAYVRGKLIAYASQKKRDSFNKIKELERETKLKEIGLSECYSESQY